MKANMSNKIIKKEFITKQTQKRLISDITNLYKNPLNEQGIYYIHDDEDMLKGHAMIIGPSDTPYEDGMYFFEFNFPYDYPINPPKVVFLNNNGRTRFNPNLYRNGKVCLSVLNTWRGEGWTSCQTIRSVLLTLVTVLNEKPLLNEPGIHDNDPENKTYNQAIEYANLSYSIIEVLSGHTSIANSIPFMNFAKEHIIKRKKEILEKVDKLLLKHPEIFIIYNSVYTMTTQINYSSLHQKMTTLFNDLDSYK